MPFFERAVALNQEPANFHYNLAASLQFLGNFEQAEAAYLETLSRDFKAYRAWSSLVGLKRQSEADNHLDALIELFDELFTERLGHQADGNINIRQDRFGPSRRRLLPFTRNGLKKDSKLRILRVFP